MFSFLRGTSEPAAAELAQQRELLVEKRRMNYQQDASYAQYAVFTFAAFQLLFGDRWYGVIALGIGAYVERIAAKYCETRLLDPEAAKYLAERYSRASQFTFFAERFIIGQFKSIEEKTAERKEPMK